MKVKAKNNTSDPVALELKAQSDTVFCSSRPVYLPASTPEKTGNVEVYCNVDGGTINDSTTIIQVTADKTSAEPSNIIDHQMSAQKEVLDVKVLNMK